MHAVALLKIHQAGISAVVNLSAYLVSEVYGEVKAFPAETCAEAAIYVGQCVATKILVCLAIIGCRGATRYHGVAILVVDHVSVSVGLVDVLVIHGLTVLGIGWVVGVVIHTGILRHVDSVS